MIGTKRKTSWTVRKAALLASLCLVAGILGGWSIGGWTTHTESVSNQPQARPAAAPSGAISMPDSLKDIADRDAAPILRKLKSDPDNPDLLKSVGNLYYDAQQYSLAVSYYSRSLDSRPGDASVRTDMATAYWFLGDADTALAEFSKALAYLPNNPNTLFNRGVVRWKGKHDAAGALADWNKLLATSPNYEGRDKVQQMIAEASGQQTARK